MKPSRKRMIATWLVVLATGAAAGCAGDARVDLATADALDSLAAAMNVTLAEYHAEIDSADSRRESAAIDAFVARVLRDAADADACAAHADDLERALAKINADRSVESSRHVAAMDNVQLLGEVGDGLRRIAVQSMALEDEARRYILSLIEAWQAARVANDAPAANESSNTDRFSLVLQGS